MTEPSTPAVTVDCTCRLFTHAAVDVHRLSSAMILAMPKPPDPTLPVLLDVLEERRVITIVLADQLDGECGRTDKHSATIFLSKENTLGEHRATLIHELCHLAKPELPEEKIEALTAEMLVPLPDALAAVTHADLHDVADVLGVDAQLVRARQIAADCEDTLVIEAVA